MKKVGSAAYLIDSKAFHEVGQLSHSSLLVHPFNIVKQIILKCLNPFMNDEESTKTTLFIIK